MNIRWTQERDEELKKLWMDGGLSKSQIGDCLGCTRNSVSGRLNRLGLEPQKTPAVAKWRPGPRQTVVTSRPPQRRFNPSFSTRERSTVPPLSPDQKEYILGQGIGLLELKPDSCRWPMNTPVNITETYLFCGAKIESKDCPYCGYHARMAYGRAA